MKSKTSILQKGIQVFLASLCVILGYILWLETKPMDISIEPMSKNVPIENDESMTFPGIENTIPDINEFDEMINRPLFSENRQPFVYEEPEEKIPEKQKSNTRKSKEEYSLKAVIITPDKQIAIIQASRAKELQRVALGETIDDWTLESVDPREIKLSNGTETKTLILEIINSESAKSSTKSNIRNRTNNERGNRQSPATSPDSKNEKNNEIDKKQEKTLTDPEANN